MGNHKNRYSNAPDVMMSGSSRGPTEDGDKPDLVAPGGYVRSCKAQEATDTGSATWSSTYYLEYTGTSMATPNAAGAAVMVREYLKEIAQRPSPQGALVKALLFSALRTWVLETSRTMTKAGGEPCATVWLLPAVKAFGTTVR